MFLSLSKNGSISIVQRIKPVECASHQLPRPAFSAKKHAQQHYTNTSCGPTSAASYNMFWSRFVVVNYQKDGVVSEPPDERIQKVCSIYLDIPAFFHSADFFIHTYFFFAGFVRFFEFTFFTFSRRLLLFGMLSLRLPSGLRLGPTVRARKKQETKH